MAANLYYKQPVVLLDDRVYTNPTSASFYIYGGAGIAKNLEVGYGATLGSLHVTGGSSFMLGITASNLNITGKTWLQGGATLGSLHVTGSSTFLGNASFDSNVTVGSLYVTSGPLLVKSNTLQIPVGDTASRPSPASAGFIRYNSEYQQFEGYGPGNTWTGLGGVVDINQDTKILAELSPGNNDDTLHFYTFGVERMIVSSYGNLILKPSQGNAYYQVDITPSYGDISKERVFTTTSNGSLAPVNITGFAFDKTHVQSFNANVCVRVEYTEGNGDPKYVNYNIRGLLINPTTGDWLLNTTFIGEKLDIDFDITSSGQLTFESTIANVSKMAFHFRATTTSVSDLL